MPPKGSREGVERLPSSESPGGDHLRRVKRVRAGTYDEFGDQWDHVSPPGQGNDSTTRRASGREGRYQVRQLNGSNLVSLSEIRFGGSTEPDSAQPNQIRAFRTTPRPVRVL